MKLAGSQIDYITSGTWSKQQLSLNDQANGSNREWSAQVLMVIIIIIIIIIIIVVVIIMSLVTGLFFLVLLLNQRWSPPLRLQASHCSTFRVMCDVPSIAVFCSESIECFPGTASKFFLKLLITIPVAPIITGMIVHFRFHIRCISIHKLLYFIFFTASFCIIIIIIIFLMINALALQL